MRHAQLLEPLRRHCHGKRGQFDTVEVLSCSPPLLSDFHLTGGLALAFSNVQRNSDAYWIFQRDNNITAVDIRLMLVGYQVKILWMLVALIEENGDTRYCGLINSRNSYGGFTGYTRFYAHLRKDEKGQLTSAELRAMEEPNRQANPLDPRWLNGICEKYGYEILISRNRPRLFLKLS